MFPYSPAQSHRSSSASHSPVASPIRTGNACQACKKRKTKCTGQPGPCANCSRTGTYCHFDIKLDGRRKHAYEAAEIQYRQQFILDALLRSIKYNDGMLVQELVEVIRAGRPLSEIAHVLQDNIKSLQDKMLAREHKVTISDLISLALNCLSDSDFRPHGNSKLSIQHHHHHHREDRLKIPSCGSVGDVGFDHDTPAKFVSKERPRVDDAASGSTFCPSSSTARSKRRCQRASKAAPTTSRGRSPEASSPSTRHRDPPPPSSGPMETSQDFSTANGWRLETSSLQSQQGQVVYAPTPPIFTSYDHMGQRYIQQVPLGYGPGCPTPQYAESLRVHYVDDHQLSSTSSGSSSSSIRLPPEGFCNSSPRFVQMSPRCDGYSVDHKPPPSQPHQLQEDFLQGYYGWSTPFAAGWPPNQASWASHT